MSEAVIDLAVWRWNRRRTRRRTRRTSRHTSPMAWMVTAWRTCTSRCVSSAGVWCLVFGPAAQPVSSFLLLATTSQGPAAPQRRDSTLMLPAHMLWGLHLLSALHVLKLGDMHVTSAIAAAVGARSHPREPGVGEEVAQQAVRHQEVEAGEADVRRAQGRPQGAFGLMLRMCQSSLTDQLWHPLLSAPHISVPTSCCSGAVMTRHFLA